jgi:uncharacterized protein (TIGR02145 family)
LWASPNFGATNESGFTAVPAGLRNIDGTFINIGGYGYWWCSSEYNTSYAWFRKLGYYGSNVHSSSYYKDGGHSVRCLKDN